MPFLQYKCVKCGKCQAICIHDAIINNDEYIIADDSFKNVVNEENQKNMVKDTGFVPLNDDAITDIDEIDNLISIIFLRKTILWLKLMFLDIKVLIQIQ